MDNDTYKVDELPEDVSTWAGIEGFVGSDGEDHDPVFMDDREVALYIADCHLEIRGGIDGADIAAFTDQIATLRLNRSNEGTTPEMLAIELAWGLIANAYGGAWSEAPEEWSKAAVRWRDEHWHPLLAKHTSQNGEAVDKAERA